MKASVKIERGIMLETECLPLEVDDFNALMDAPADQFTPRELRLMATIMIIVATNQERADLLSAKVEELRRDVKVLEESQL